MLVLNYDYSHIIIFQQWQTELIDYLTLAHIYKQVHVQGIGLTFRQHITRHCC